MALSTPITSVHVRRVLAAFSATVGLPATPVPLVTVRPVPAVSVLATVVLRAVRTTMPLPPGSPSPAIPAAHVPSPRQKVAELAPVPLLRLFTDRLPVTPVDRGKPVPLVSVTLVGVPSMGATIVLLESV